MASLDWAHLHPTTRSPLPLPSEKFLLTTSSVSLSLFPCLVGSSPSVAAQPHKEYTVSSGTLHASSKRVVYVADVGAKRTVPAGRGGGAGLDGLGGGGELETLSVPYSHFLDGRFQQPWFGASYYESLCLPSEGGGLSEPHLLRLTFKESGGGQFFEVVEEMKARLAAAGASGSSAAEPLPLYTPASPLSTDAPPSLSPDIVTTPPALIAEDESIARAVRTAEEEEAERDVLQGGVRPPSAISVRREGGGASEDGPPGYAP